MADPLSTTASLLAITTAAVQATKSLYEAVKRYRGRDKTLHRLQDELEDLTKILDSLTKATSADESMLELLQSPVQRCSQICRDFESTMEIFTKKTKPGLRDWARMEFMRGDINEFIDTVAGYKSTISVALGTVTIRTSKISHHVLSQYNEMIQDTVYGLELHLRRIDEKMTQLTSEHINTTRVNIDLRDERQTTEQCLRICEDAKTYLQSLSNRASSLLQETPQTTVGEPSFEAQLRMKQALDESRDRFTQTIGHISKRLEYLAQHPGSDGNEERLRLQTDIEISKQCLDVCSIASEVSHQKIYRIGEVVADGESDQVVVTTLADLFDVGKAISKNKSAQLVGSMTAESLQHLTEQRYSSRFGANGTNSATLAGADSLSTTEAQKGKQPSLPQSSNYEPLRASKTPQKKPFSNEMRKRMSGDATGSGEMS